jgi:hypothetical protein
VSDAAELTLAQVMLPENANPRRKHGRPTTVRPLQVCTPEQQQNWEAAEERRARRMRDKPATVKSSL